MHLLPPFKDVARLHLDGGVGLQGGTLADDKWEGFEWGCGMAGAMAFDS